MFKQLKNKNEGFTIIEVLIVLAIAGLIMVIVFLAVPALQRNNRNTQRDADAQRIVSAVNECVANNNGQTTNCQTQANLNNYVNFGNNQQLTALTGAGLQSAALAFSSNCNSSGTAAQGGQPPRSFALTYLVETSGGSTAQCIGG